MTDTRPSLTIIGFGAFGRLLAHHLAPHASLTILDADPTARDAARARGLDVLTDPSALTADIVVLAVPLPALGTCLAQIAPHLRPGQIVADTCSIKEAPARLMRELLPKHVEVLATHPMFGPNSAGKDLRGQQLVLCPVRGKRWRRLGALLRRGLGLQVIVTTPTEHDRQAAVTQGLTHLLARAFSMLGDQPRIRTRSFALMSDALAMVAGDAPEVFEAVTRQNPHVLPLARDFTQKLKALGETALTSGD
ncbi:prephenate dehydrogenase [Allosediminivita pacifica]|uniref:Prephenate dehydrogenase n=1 Tax=Allosediminivita pacifica TaxID=1267769 RepID=A0A2T6B9N7_9RHOB|nr:prephenate dehydrogenase [Allosediminivita pacifica]PTX52742.1 prephenate dehydrogenase [Allosediminivita pacifica]GGA96214.1 hypothetical protein GCM10011324_03120 [Allosediminivita pacifica]